jgi:hypothetical protein
MIVGAITEPVQAAYPVVVIQVAIQTVEGQAPAVAGAPPTTLARRGAAAAVAAVTDATATLLSTSAAAAWRRGRGTTSIYDTAAVADRGDADSSRTHSRGNRIVTNVGYDARV